MARLSADRWRTLSPHLDRGLEMKGDARAAWLDALRAGDEALAADLEALFEAHAVLDREGFLEVPPSRPAVSLAGSTLGAYTLVSPIGHGGMGTVWLARRSDGRFQGRAAVKLLNASLVGRDGEERFRREGSILARLKHPHVAHLLDAGVSAAGQPYLVLEYVEGQPIDRYCDAEGLSIERRLRLFLEVTDAVAYAHSQLIVHRDLKPSNVLVASDGRARLLDFGIAKLIEPVDGTGEISALTREGGHPLTPEYAAPEQLTGEAITTATDVYALGTLLFVLLTGRHPMGASPSSPAHLLKAIVDTEPPRVSEVVSEPGSRRRLHGDLDTIVARALKKNPSERYATVGALADDLRRHLEDRPIRARPDRWLYRTAKLVRRNRVAVTLAASAFLALSAGLAGTVSQARRASANAANAEGSRRRADQEARAAREQRDFALRQLSRAEAINGLNSFLLSDAAPSGSSFTAGDLLARAERIVARQQGDTPENRIEMLIAIGSLYGSREEEGKARELLERAYKMSREVADPSIRAKAAAALAGEIAPAGDFERAEGLIRESLAGLGQSPQFVLHRVYCLLRGCYVAREAGDLSTAIERVQAARRLLETSGQGSALLDLSVSTNLAESYRMAGRNREAVAAFESSFSRLSALGREDTEEAGTLLNNWGLAVLILGRPVEAERLFRRAAAIGSADGTDRGVSPMLLNNLARPLVELGRFGEALVCAERAYSAARQARDENIVNQTFSVRFGIYVEQRDFASASRMLVELEPRWKRMMPARHIAFAVLSMYKGALASGRGDHKTAVAESDRAVSLAEANVQAADYLPNILMRRADVNLAAGRFEPARADAERALAMEAKSAAGDEPSSRIGRAYLMLARSLSAEGRSAEARAAAAAAAKHLQSSLGADHPKSRAARELAAAALPPAAVPPASLRD